MFGISWIWWFLGTFGIGGAIAVWLLGPVVVFGIIKATLSFLLGTRIGCALLAGVLMFLLADYNRGAKDDAEQAQRQAEFEQLQDKRDAKIKTDTRELVWKEIADATVNNTAIDKDVKDFNNALLSPTPVMPAGAPAPAVAAGNPFRIADADAARLCRIAGKTKCQPRRAQGVPTAQRPARGAGNLRERLSNAVRGGAGRNQ